MWGHAGAVAWMHDGSGIVHSERTPEAWRVRGGVGHDIQGGSRYRKSSRPARPASSWPGQTRSARSSSGARRSASSSARWGEFAHRSPPALRSCSRRRLARAAVPGRELRREHRGPPGRSPSPALVTCASRRISEPSHRTKSGVRMPVCEEKPG